LGDGAREIRFERERGISTSWKGILGKPPVLLVPLDRIVDGILGVSKREFKRMEDRW
jgi:hypothetical protein